MELGSVTLKINNQHTVDSPSPSLQSISGSAACEPLQFPCVHEGQHIANSFVILLQMFDWSKVSTLTSQITLINRHKVFGMGGTMGRNVNA